MTYKPVFDMWTLLREHGRHLGGSRACSCCGNHTLYRIPGQGEAEWFIACSNCDTEKK